MADPPGREVHRAAQGCASLDAHRRGRFLATSQCMGKPTNVPKTESQDPTAVGLGPHRRAASTPETKEPGPVPAELLHPFGVDRDESGFAIDDED